TAGEIDLLHLSSRNLRKLGALDHLLRTAPGDVIAYADSDVLFLPGWLERSLAVLAAFPEAGQVPAPPPADPAGRHCASTYAGVARSRGLVVEEGRDLLPQRYVDAHRRSLGVSRAEYTARLADVRVMRLTRGETRAYVSAQD